MHDGKSGLENHSLEVPCSHIEFKIMIRNQVIKTKTYQSRVIFTPQNGDHFLRTLPYRMVFASTLMISTVLCMRLLQVEFTSNSPPTITISFVASM